MPNPPESHSAMLASCGTPLGHVTRLRFCDDACMEGISRSLAHRLAGTMDKVDDSVQAALRNLLLQACSLESTRTHSTTKLPHNIPGQANHKTCGNTTAVHTTTKTTTRPRETAQQKYQYRTNPDMHSNSRATHTNNNA
jgi:hypothetical protein